MPQLKNNQKYNLNVLFFLNLSTIVCRIVNFHNKTTLSTQFAFLYEFYLQKNEIK